jgi:hypothetical protein
MAENYLGLQTRIIALAREYRHCLPVIDEFCHIRIPSVA